MFTPLKTTRTFHLGKYTFHLFSLEDFNFHESIDVSNEAGLYCFSHVEHIEIDETSKKIDGCSKWKDLHLLLYLGKSEDKDGINGRLTAQHEKFDGLKDANANFLGIYECQDQEDPKNVESEILKQFWFQKNDSENHNSELPSQILED